jgi:predicted phage terminase large subunit-like protein
MFFGTDKKRRLTAKQFDAEVEALVRYVQTAVSPFTQDSAEKKEARLRQAREDQDFFNRTYLPHYFNQAAPDFHHEIEAMIEEGERQQRPVGIAAPRGHAKSTRITFAYALKQALFSQKKFLLIISDTALQASGFTVSQRVEAEHNPRILHDFGPQKTGQWAAGDFTLRSGTRILARGDGQGIRGLKNGPHRPDLAIIDDIDNDESVRNPERPKQSYQWLLEAVIPSLDPATGVLFIVGTLLSKRSILAKCQANTAFLARVYRAVENPEWDQERNEFLAGTPLWPQRFSLKKLSQTRHLIGSVAFNKEYQNDPRDDDGMFREEWIKRFKPADLSREPLFYYQGIDPSLKSGQANDYKALVTVAKGAAKVYCVHASITRSSLDQMVRTAFTLHARYHALQVGLETVGWQELLRRDFDREAEKSGRYLPIVPIERQGLSKESEARIGGLSPLVENGVLQFADGPAHEVGDMDTLIEQLLYFPTSSVHDDGPDALEIAVHLADKRTTGKPSYERVAGYPMQFAQEGTW